MADPVYRKVTDGAGNVSYIEVTTSSPLDSLQSWMVARSGEASTKIGVIGGAVAAPTIADNLGKALIAGLAGDYMSAALYGVPAVLGTIASISAIITAEKPKGPTDDQIKNHVAALSRDELVSLLTKPVSTVQQTG